MSEVALTATLSLRYAVGAITMCLCRQYKETLEKHYKRELLSTKFMVEVILKRTIKPKSNLDRLPFLPYSAPTNRVILLPFNVLISLDYFIEQEDGREIDLFKDKWYVAFKSAVSKEFSNDEIYH